MQIKLAKFVISNTDYRKCPPPEMPEFAFIGRSNVGKSSLINTLVSRKNLAKTSGTPGKTQLINHFLINEEWYLVDLPGYGYAKTSKSNRANWEKMISNYLLNRDNLVTTFILIDSRLEPQKVDQEFMTWMGKNELSFVIAFTKTDKITKTKLAGNLKSWKEFLQKYWEDLPLSILTSSKTKLGKEDVTEVIEKMME